MKKVCVGLQKAVDRSGGVRQLAGLIGVTHTTIIRWLNEDGVSEDDLNALNDTGIAKVIALANGTWELAKTLGVHYQAVQAWKRQGFVPVKYVAELENTYGVPRIDLVSAKVRNAMGAGGEL